MTYIFSISVILILIGELADKSQLLALGLATKYKPWLVLAAISLATFVVHFFTTWLGMALGDVIPDRIIPWVVGILFIGFGIWTLRGDQVDEVEEDSERSKSLWRAFWFVAIAFFVAELGDKTQIMTATIAADPGGVLLETLKGFGPRVADFLASIGLTGPGEVSRTGTFWMVTLGSTLGMVLADALAIGVGAILGKNLPEKVLTRISGTIFLLFGIVALIGAIMGSMS